MDNEKTEMIVYVGPLDKIRLIETMAERHTGLKHFYKGKQKNIV